MKVLSVVGARPQFIKLAAVSRVLRTVEGVREVVVHTGQHYDDNMSDVFFRELDIPAPQYNLGVGGGGHGRQTGAMLAAVEEVLLAERPDWMLVYGDTNSTLAGALAAVKLHVPVAHVEAGLRSHNLLQPEEANRICTDHVSALCFAPTEGAVAELRREGFEAERIRLSGDVMYDAALHFGGLAERESTVLERVGVQTGGYVLTTVHRPENTDQPERLANLVAAIGRMARRLPVVWPLHPRTAGRLRDAGLAPETLPGVHVIPPVPYLDMIMLEKHAALVASDSGGVPKEAFFYQVPSVILRKDAIWTELVELGWTRAVPADSVEALVAAMDAALGSRGRPGAPYGDGCSAERIAADLCGGPLSAQSGLAAAAGG